MDNLDETNKKILNILQRGDLCIPKVTQIAEQLEIPTATVHTRIKKLQKAGIIKGYPADLDSKKVGKNVIIFVVLKVVYAERYSGRRPIGDFADKLSRVPEIQEIHMCSGDWDYLIKVKVKDTDDYNRVLTEKILPLGGIEKAESRVAYQTFKETQTIEV